MERGIKSDVVCWEFGAASPQPSLLYWVRCECTESARVLVHQSTAGLPRPKALGGKNRSVFPSFPSALATTFAYDLRLKFL